MSSGKHTSGPWVVRSDGHYPVVRKEFRPGHHMDVCGPVHGYMYSSNEAAEQAANARLIAAAPDLYEALKDVRSVARGPAVDGSYTIVLGGIDLERVDAALAKVAA